VGLPWRDLATIWVSVSFLRRCLKTLPEAWTTAFDRLVILPGETVDAGAEAFGR
jgi:hypothetical protein